MKRLLGSARARSAALFVVAVALWAAVLPRMRVDTSIAHFLPESQDPRAAGLLRSLAESELASVTILHLYGGDEDALVSSTKKIIAGLRALPTTREVRSGLDQDAERAMFEFLSSYPPSGFLPLSPFTDEAIDARVAKLKSDLGGPFGPVVRLTAPRDPMCATFDLLRVLREEQGSAVTTRDGVLVSNDGAHAFVFLTPNGNAFDASLQRASLAGIERVVAASATPGIHSEIAGVCRYAIESEQQIKGDIQRIGTLSTLGVLLLFAVVFRSVRMLVLGLVPLLFGTMVATLGTYLLFGSVHGLTLVFGTSLLGVGIDYAEHYYAHFALEPDVGAVAMMRRVWPGLFMGALTTIVGLAGLAWADFPGAIQMAVFSTLAVIGALVGTRWLLPAWMPEGYRRPAMLGRVEAFFSNELGVLGRFRRWPWVPLAITGVVAIGLVRVSFIDDMKALLDVDPALTATDERVQGLLSGADPGRFAVVVGRDEERLAEDLDQAEEELAAAEHAGILAHFMPLGALLRSPAAQRASRARAIETLPALHAALARQGFRPEAFAPYEDALRHPAKEIVTLADVLASPIGPLVRPLSFDLGAEHAFVLPLGGVRSLAELRRAVLTRADRGRSLAPRGDVRSRARSRDEPDRSGARVRLRHPLLALPRSPPRRRRDGPGRPRGDRDHGVLRVDGQTAQHLPRHRARTRLVDGRRLRHLRRRRARIAGGRRPVTRQRAHRHGDDHPVVRHARDQLEPRAPLARRDDRPRDDLLFRSQPQRARGLHAERRAMRARSGACAAAFAAILVGLGACAPKGTSPPLVPEHPYACVLRPLATLGPDFVARQRVEASGHGGGGGFDAVLQKKGDKLVLIGLFAGIRAFVLEEEGERISFEQTLGPKFPFPPEYAVIDVHRVYWKQLPRDASAPATGIQEGELDGEKVREVWSNGSLVEKDFARPGERSGVVRINYGEGCTAERCLPKSVRIENEWFGYTVRIENRELTLL